MLSPDDTAAVFNIARKVFSGWKANLEEEKRAKGILRRAQDKDTALAALDRMWNEGVRYPTGLEFRRALDAEHQVRAFVKPESRIWDPIPDCCPGTFDTTGFVHWWTVHASDTSKEQARRAAEGLTIMARWVKAAEA